MAQRQSLSELKECNSHDAQKIKGDRHAFLDPREVSHSAAIIKH